MANEKTLELNITHQLLNEYSRSFAIGSTLQEENTTGSDSYIFTPYNMFVFQYKAAILHKGQDGIDAYFKINNNSTRDQHIKLFNLSQAYPKSVFYAFPLTINDVYFQAHASGLLHFTVFVSVEAMPRFNEGEVHLMHVHSNGNWIANSEESKGEGIIGKNFITHVEDNQMGTKVNTDKESLSFFFTNLKKHCESDEFSLKQINLTFMHPVKSFVFLPKMWKTRGGEGY